MFKYVQKLDTLDFFKSLVITYSTQRDGRRPQGSVLICRIITTNTIVYVAARE